MGGNVVDILQVDQRDFPQGRLEIQGRIRNRLIVLLLPHRLESFIRQIWHGVEFGCGCVRELETEITFVCRLRIQRLKAPNCGNELIIEIFRVNIRVRIFRLYLNLPGLNISGNLQVLRLTQSFDVLFLM